MEAFQDAAVKAVFDAYPHPLKDRLIRLRQLIFNTAAETDAVVRLEETLKWGQPSYLTSETKSGTTIRIDQYKKTPGRYGMFVHCQTSLLSTYRELFPGILKFDGNRGIVFDLEDEVPQDAVRTCIARALTYHLNKRRDRLPF